VNCSEFVFAPVFESLTVTFAVPSFARSSLESAAERVVEFTTVVARTAPFHNTTDVLPNEGPPAAVSVSAASPASAVDGEIDVKADVEFEVVDVNVDDDGCAQEMSSVQSATTRAMVAFSLVIDGLGMNCTRRHANACGVCYARE
jgi:hypothetical protein